MQTHTEADYGHTEKRAERRNKGTETEPSENVLELRGRIRSGFYDSKEVVMEIVNKLLTVIKVSNE